MRVVIGWVAMAFLVGCMKAEPTPQAARLAPASRVAEPVVAPAMVAPAPAAAEVVEPEDSARDTDAAQDPPPSIKLADPGRAAEREAARAAVRDVAGVRSATWLDRENLLVHADRNDADSYAMIDAVCVGLAPMGDAQGVVVNLKRDATLPGGGIDIVSRGCGVPSPELALQAPPETEALTQELRAQRRKSNVLAEDDASQREAEAKESMRVLEANTPEMGHIDRQ